MTDFEYEQYKNMPTQTYYTEIDSYFAHKFEGNGTARQMRIYTKEELEQRLNDLKCIFQPSTFDIDKGWHFFPTHGRLVTDADGNVDEKHRTYYSVASVETWMGKTKKSLPEYIKRFVGERKGLSEKVFLIPNSTDKIKITIL